MSSSDVTEIQLHNATLREIGDDIVAQGWFDLDAMNLIKVDDYQREVLASIRKKGKILSAIEANKILPPITVGMRGEHYHMQGKSTMILEDPVYIVDGLQRIFAMKMAMNNDPERSPLLLLSAEVRFNTTKQKEKELFEEMNINRTPVSPNVILRNRRDAHPGVLTLYGLSKSDKNSPIYGRVCWQQRMNRGELFTALMVSKVTLRLHSHRGVHSPGRIGAVPDALDRGAELFGLRIFRENVLAFFQLIDACWSIADIEYTQKATHTKGNFMEALAYVLSRHSDFWEGPRLTITTAQKNKIKSFPVNDPEVMRLAGAGNMALPLLANLMIEHYNKGKKAQGRLRVRDTSIRRAGAKRKDYQLEAAE